MATLDPPLDVLRRQIVAASSVSLAEIGWIAGASHRQSGPHFPERPAPPGNPVDEVDAIDPPHDPARGADMGVVTEALRLSRDPRIKLVIFNRRIFSSYAHAEGPPYTWRPYREKDPHTRHAHIERTDTLRNDLRPWQIGIDDMVTAVEIWKHDLADDIGGVVRVDPAYHVLNRAAAQSAEAVALGKANAAALAELKARPPVQPAPVDPAALKAALLSPDFLAAVAKAVVDEDHRRSAA